MFSLKFFLISAKQPLQSEPIMGDVKLTKIIFNKKLFGLDNSQEQNLFDTDFVFWRERTWTFCFTLVTIGSSATILLLHVDAFNLPVKEIISDNESFPEPSSYIFYYYDDGDNDDYEHDYDGAGYS